MRSPLFISLLFVSLVLIADASPMLNAVRKYLADRVRSEYPEELSESRITPMHSKRIRSMVQTQISDDMKDPLPTLDSNMALRVLSKLSPEDIARFALTNKHFKELAKDNYLWQQFYIQYFGTSPPPLADGETYFNLLAREIKKSHIPYKDCQICHFNYQRPWEGHWHLGYDGDIVTLDNVCFLDCRAWRWQLPPGTYQIFWKLRFRSSNIHAFARTRINATQILSYTRRENGDIDVEDGEVLASFTLPTDIIPQDMWIFVTDSAQLVTVSEPTDVRITMQDHSDDWKYYMDMEYLWLRKVKDEPVRGTRDLDPLLKGIRVVDASKPRSGYRRN